MKVFKTTFNNGDLPRKEEITIDPHDVVGLKEPHPHRNSTENITKTIIVFENGKGILVWGNIFEIEEEILSHCNKSGVNLIL